MFGIKNPQSLLQPWQSLKQFTEELYASLTPEDGAAAPSTVQTEGNPQPQIPLPAPPPSVQVVVSPPVLGRARPAPTLADFQSQTEPQPTPTSSLSIAWPTGAAPPQSARRQQSGASAGNPSRTEDAVPSESGRQEIAKHKRRPDYDGKAIYPRFPGVENRAPQTGGGLMGRVLSGSGDIYLVQLYSAGPDGPPDLDGLITVQVPQIADTEKIPAGTWCQPILDTGDVFVYQPPIWL